MDLIQHQTSRRDLIKKGAVAGAIFWSAPVIESVTSRAAAQSNQCTSTGTFNASYVFVVFTYGGNTYFTGFKQNEGCGTQGANEQGTACTGDCSGTYYYLNTFNGGASTGDITSSTTSCDAAAASTTGPIYVGSATCSEYLTISGGTVSAAQPGVQIVAGFCAGASTVTGSCATMESSSGCTYATCG